MTADLASVRAHGISEPVLAAWTAEVPGLNQLQQDVINQAGLLIGDHVLVTAPTSSGQDDDQGLAAFHAAQPGAPPSQTCRR